MKNQTEAEELSAIKKKSVSGAVSYFLRTIFLQAIGIVSIFVLSAYFKPEDFGIYGFVVQIIGLLIFFSDVGLAAALIQKKEEPTVEDYRTTFTVQQILSWAIVLCAVLISTIPTVSEKTGTAGFWILISLALSFPLASLKTIPSVILERQLQFSKLVIPQIFEQLVFHSTLIFLAVNNMGAIAYAYAIILRSIVGVISMSLLQRWPIGFHISKASLKQLLQFGFKFQLNDFLARIKDQLFYLVLGWVMPLREFGYVQWAKNWSLYPYNLTVQNVMAVTFPTFARLQHNKEALRKAIETSLFFITLAIFPILAGIVIFIQPFITLFPVYQQWQPAVPSLIFFTLSIAWSAVSSPLTNTLSAIGKIDKTLQLMILWTVLTWILTPVMMYFFGYNGIALAALLISFSSYLAVHYVKKVVNFDFFNQIWRQLLASFAIIVVGFVGSGIWSQSFVLFILGGAIAVLSYVIVFFVVGKNKFIVEMQRLGISLPKL